MSDGQVPQDGERVLYQTGISNSIKRQKRGRNISILKHELRAVAGRPKETGITDQRSL